ncbi:MAG: phage integrase N-terminal SAM-like domain-containing protein [Candidatus Hodarchaeota archaeon]
MSKTKDRKLMDEVPDMMRLHHYSICTERSYCDWIKRFVQFLKMTLRKDLKKMKTKIESMINDKGRSKKDRATILVIGESHKRAIWPVDCVMRPNSS